MKFHLKDRFLTKPFLALKKKKAVSLPGINWAMNLMISRAVELLNFYFLYSFSFFRQQFSHTVGFDSPRADQWFNRQNFVINVLQWYQFKPRSIEHQGLSTYHSTSYQASPVMSIGFWPSLLMHPRAGSTLLRNIQKFDLPLCGWAVAAMRRAQLHEKCKGETQSMHLLTPPDKRDHKTCREWPSPQKILPQTSASASGQSDQTFFCHTLQINIQSWPKLRPDLGCPYCDWYIKSKLGP